MNRLPKKTKPTRIDRHSFDEECECAICKNKANYAAWENKQMLDNGWYVHFVFDADYMPYSVCYHTHGIRENFDHPDLQIVFNVDNEVAHKILWTVFDRIDEGEKFETDKRYDKIISEGFDVMFINAIEGGRDVLRIIFPDSENKLSQSEIDTSFSKQWECLQGE